MNATPLQAPTRRSKLRYWYESQSRLEILFTCTFPLLRTIYCTCVTSVITSLLFPLLLYIFNAHFPFHTDQRYLNCYFLWYGYLQNFKLTQTTRSYFQWFHDRLITSFIWLYIPIPFGLLFFILDLKCLKIILKNIEIDENFIFRYCLNLTEF